MSTPYIGSKISLISKSEIRYEGILYTVDPQESTIALAKVRTFGTENRTTEHPTPPREEIFEYIIFKATDIKDIVVCETPQPVPQLYGGLPYDPAIVSVSKQTTSQQQNAHQSGPHVDTQLNSNVSKAAAGSGTSSPSLINQSFSPLLDVGHTTGQSFQNKAPGAGRRDSSSRGGYQQQRQAGFNQNSNEFRQHNEVDDSFNETTPGFGGFHNRDNMQNRGAWRSRGAWHRGNSTSNGSYMGRGGYPDHHRGSGSGSGGGGFIPRGGNQSMRGGSGPYRADGQRYDGDYDFETANERFKETLDHLKDEFSTKAKFEDNNDESSIDDSSDVTAQLANTSAENEKNSYDKTKSFFDHISCEALERMEGSTRPNWRRERELNQETFGQSGFRNYRYKRGGVGRPGGGGRGGGYRGRGGYYGGGNRFQN